MNIPGSMKEMTYEEKKTNVSLLFRRIPNIA